MENCKRNHFFEMSPASGVFVYIVDQDEPVYLKFTNAIRIKVLFDTFDQSCDKSSNVVLSTAVLHPPHQSMEQPCENSLVTDSTSQYGDEAVEQFICSEPTELEKTQESLSQSQNTPSDNVSSDMEIDSATKSGISDTKKIPNRLKAMSKLTSVSTPIKFETEIISGKCLSVAEASSETYHVKLRSATGKVAKKIKDKLSVKRKTKRKKSKDYGKILVRIKKHRNLSAPSVEKNILKNQLNAVQDKSHKMLKEKTIKCEYCEVEFCNQLDFYNHRRAEESKHACVICGKVEPYEAHLIVHMQKHRRIKTDASSLGQSSSETAASIEEFKTGAGSGSDKKKKKKVRMKCNVCGLVLSSTDSLKIHTMLHTGECAYRCCVCGEKFSSLSSRQHHMDTHVSVQRFKCNPCGQRFPSRADLAKHQLTHEIKCALCGEVFPNKTSRTCHFRVSHPEDILKCTQCSNMFDSEEDFNRHMVYHKKGKKEQCPVCGIVVSKLKDHMLLHSQQAQEKMFVCDQCPMSYLRKSNLDRHMRTHTGEKPYACNVCTKCFRSNGMLRKHLLTHTQERPYQCEICGKRCSLRSNLNIHMRVHNSDKQFPCTLCSQAFNHKNSLRGHMKSKHSRDLNSQARLVKQACHPVEQQAVPHLMAEMEVEHAARNAPLSSPSSLGPDLIVKPDSSMAPHQHEFSNMQLNYTSNIHNLPANLLLDNDRMPLLKYFLQPQNTPDSY